MSRTPAGEQRYLEGIGRVAVDGPRVVGEEFRHPLGECRILRDEQAGGPSQGA